MKTLLCLCLITSISYSNNLWKSTQRLTTQVDNIHIEIPQTGPIYEHRETIAQEIIRTQAKIKKRFQIESSQEVFHMKIYNSREELQHQAGRPASGLAYAPLRTVYLTGEFIDGKFISPLEHELTHLLLELAWGRPHWSIQWLNEGIATLQQNDCAGYHIDEVYEHLVDKKLLIPTHSLTKNFYQLPDMVSYHQAAILAQEILKKKGIQGLRQLWQKGNSEIPHLLNQSLHQIQEDYINSRKAQNHIQWDNEEFNKGCINLQKVYSTTN